MLIGPLSLPSLTTDGRLSKIGQFLREPSLRETTKRWMALHLSIDGEGADWVMEPKGAIKKANLTFTTNLTHDC